MNVIRPHNVMIQGRKDQFAITLRPLTDADFPLLSKWYSDPEVLYWTEFEETNPYTPEIVEKIYHMVSQKALCFAIEINGVPIGDCWLQEMNLPEVIAMYPVGTDVRRIDMAIGEKEYWSKGIGSTFIKMLIDHAFCVEKIDVLHCLCADYNIRSQRMWEKNGFTCVLTEKAPEIREDGAVCHWRLTKEVYLQQSLPLGCESIVKKLRKAGKSHRRIDMQQQTLQGADMGSILNFRLSIQPIKVYFNRLPNAADVGRSCIR